MPVVRWAMAIFLLAGSQEQIVQLVLTTKDGHRIVGIPSSASLKIESSLGVVDTPLKNLMKIKFEGETVTATGKDGTTLKGKLQQTSLKFTTLIGELEFKPDGLKEAMVQHALANAPFGGRMEGQVVLLVRTKDGNDLVGTTDLAKIPFESTIAKFEVDVMHVSSMTRATEPNILSLLDGSEIRGTVKLPSVKIQSSLGEFTIKPEDISVIQHRGTRPAPKAPSPPPPPKGPMKGPASDAPPKPPAIEALGKAETKAVLSDLRVSKDGKKLYAINLSDGKVCRWKLPGLEEDGSVSVKGGEKALALDPNETRAFAGGQNTISIFGTDPLTLQISFAVDIGIEDVVAIDKDLLLTTGPQGTALISISKTAVIDKQRGGTAKLVAGPKSDRFYVGETIITIERETGGKARIQALNPRVGMYPVGFGMLGMVVSPDGRYGCTLPDARVLRLGRCWAAAGVQVAQLDNNSAAAFSKNGDRLHVFTDLGFLKVYETGEFNLLASHFLGVRAAQAIMDSEGTSLIVAGIPLGEPAGRRSHSPSGLVGQVVNLYRFALPK